MEEKKSAVSWYVFALRYLAMKWPHAAPNTRDGINESLTSVTLVLLDERAGRPSDEVIRKALRNWAFVLPGPDDREVPDDVRNLLHWVSKASRPLADLAEPATARAVLGSLKLKLDGTAAAAETARRKRPAHAHLRRRLGYDCPQHRWAGLVHGHGPVVRLRLDDADGTVAHPRGERP
jgi:hypothetical protein